MNTQVPQMRTVKELVSRVKELDPQTHITESAVRRLIKCGELPHISIGRKVLISVEVFDRYLNSNSE